MTPLEILKAARETISSRKSWTTGTFARDIGGRDVSSVDAAAVCWCAVGAIHHVTSLDDDDSRSAKLALIGIIGHSAIAEWNDHATHAEVLAVFDAAISNLQKEAATSDG